MPSLKDSVQDALESSSGRKVPYTKKPTGTCPGSEAARPFREGARGGEAVAATGAARVALPFGAGLGARGARDAAGVEEARAAARGATLGFGAAGEGAGAGLGVPRRGMVSGEASGGRSGSLRSFVSSRRSGGKTSPLFPCRCSMPAVASSFRSTSVSIRMMIAPDFWASRTMDLGPPVVSWVPTMRRTSQSSILCKTVFQ
mmetsp:Transcript_61459/g.114933  ORF Transcript_61459/g.114933 Transcript_61459/m.114933 type:complete len:201 (-) Transcript_61459:645-1247(-)